VKWYCSFFIICLFLNAPLAVAFYAWEGPHSSGDARLLLRGFGIAIDNPDNSSQTNQQDEQGLGGLVRVITESNIQQNGHAEFNAYQTYISKKVLAGQDTVLDVERSGALEWSLSNDEYAHLAIDRLNARWSMDAFDISIGRQAINLASTFFFSPNDFFAPFSAQAFYRVYKPGVDAIRAEMSTGELSGVSVYAVQGYKKEADSASGWSDDAQSSRNSYLMRYVTNRAGFEWGLVVGKVRRTRVQGGSISGELFGWLGVRAEGHQLRELDNEQSRYSKYSLGFEHRWENSLMVQIEQYYHGPGATDVAQYDFAQTYPGRRYQALGLSYEVSPLLMAQFSFIRNQLDASRLYNMNTVYSLSNESELAVSFSLPDGEKADGLSIKSEFGSYPAIINLEIRGYF